MLAFIASNPETALQVALLGLAFGTLAVAGLVWALDLTAAKRRRNRFYKRQAKRRAANLAAFRRRVRSA